jgi:hypothetical protein
VAGTITRSINVARSTSLESTGERPSVVLHPGPFVRRALLDESSRLEVSVEEFITFAVLYYLTDLDASRVRRGIRAAGSSPNSPFSHLRR